MTLVKRLSRRLTVEEPLTYSRILLAESGSDAQLSLSPGSYRKDCAIGGDIGRIWISPSLSGNVCDFTDYSSITRSNVIRRVTAKKLKSYVIPIFSDRLTSFSWATAFKVGPWEQMTGISSMSLNPELQYVCKQSFKDCTSLASIDLLNVCEIGQSTFEGDVRLSSVYATAVSSVGSYAFKGCLNLSSVELESAVELGEGALSGCSQLGDVSLPRLSGQIPSKMFSDCIALSSVRVGLITQIGSSAFQNCQALKAFDFGQISSAADYAFAHSGLSGEVTVLTSIELGQNAFEGCGSLAKVNFPGMNLRAISKRPNYPWGLSESQIGCIEPSGLYLSDDVTAHFLNETISPTTGRSRAHWNDAIDVVFDYSDIAALTEDDINLSLAAADLTRNDVFVPMLGDSTLSIGQSAFADCTALQCIAIPATTKQIHASAFIGCTAMSSIDAQSVSSLGDFCYAGCTAISSIDFPDLSTVGRNAFDGCIGIDSISFHSLTSADDYSFKGCANAANVMLPQLKQAGSGFLSGCSRVVELDLPSLTAVNTGLFDGIPSLERFYGDSVQGGDLTEFGRSLKLSSIDCSGMADLPAGALQNNNVAVNMEFDSAAAIGEYAVASCTNLVSFSANSAKAVSAYAFKDDDRLRLLDLNSAEVIGVGAFMNDWSLNSVYLPQAKVLSANAFYYCTSLLEIKCPNVETLGESTFAYCYSLSSIDLPEVRSIPSHAFNQCTSLTGFDFTHAQSIGANAFEHCTNISTVVFDCDETTFQTMQLGSDIFKDCGNLLSVVFPNVRKSVLQVADNYPWGISDETRFYCHRELGILNVPPYACIDADVISAALSSQEQTAANITDIIFNSSVDTIISDYAFSDNFELVTHLEIPWSVKSIDQNAFSGCKLSSINFKISGDIPTWENIIHDYSGFPWNLSYSQIYRDGAQCSSISLLLRQKYDRYAFKDKGYGYNIDQHYKDKWGYDTQILDMTRYQKISKAFIDNQHIDVTKPFVAYLNDLSCANITSNSFNGTKLCEIYIPEYCATNLVMPIRKAVAHYSTGYTCQYPSYGFVDCGSLQQIDIGTEYSYRGGLMNSDQTTLIRGEYYDESIGYRLFIPETVDTIEDFAFTTLSSGRHQTLEIPKTVTTIGTHAFVKSAGKEVQANDGISVAFRERNLADVLAIGGYPWGLLTANISCEYECNMDDYVTLNSSIVTITDEMKSKINSTGYLFIGPELTSFVDNYDASEISGLSGLSRIVTLGDGYIKLNRRGTSIIADCPNLEHISFASRVLNGQISSNIIIDCPSLTSISLPHISPSQADGTLAKLLGAIPTLKTVDMQTAYAGNSSRFVFAAT